MQLPGKLGAFLLLLASALGTSLVLEGPSRDLVLLGRTLEVSGRLLLGLVLVVLSWTGSSLILDAMSAGAAHSPGGASSPLQTAIASAAGLIWISALSSSKAQIVGILLIVGLEAVLIIAEGLAQKRRPASWAAETTAVQLMTYPVALLAFGAGSLVASTALQELWIVIMLATVLAWHPLQSIPASLLPLAGPLSPAVASRIQRIAQRTWARALAAGIGVGLFAPIVRATGASTLAHAMHLTVAFYLWEGLIRHFLTGRLNWRIVLEYTGVALLTTVTVALVLR